MKPAPFAAALIGLTALTGCVAPIGPVEVTRFHEPSADNLLFERGTIAVEAAPGANPDSLEFRSFQMAVARQLTALGFREATTGDSAQVALVRVERTSFRPGRDGGPVSVGVGGSTGSYGSGVGMGIGIDLSGPPPEQVTTELWVQIRNRASGSAVWEGRARFTVRSDSPLAGTQLGAPKLAEALFRNFPGVSGQTVEVK
ncbi:hypothetical protein MB02_02165 [Croceicoccus estronivorus]|uniref:DUF4136 domain-containing protein n=1 Tax=Croceicoccus estronivorus TaxID=1172626 RepID=UPI00082CA91D|nr:DUF4136 domain-containing protein [Croceicoccus estronivorus]OCC25709.1 hypothetical protein MB02_02165 [Croceicoccus estronivorus]